MITERRQYLRKTPLEFTFIQLEQEFAGRVLNYSKEGLCFETAAPICDSDMVQFWLSFSQHGQIDGVGRITWLNDKKNLGGIAFVHLSRTSRQKLDEWTTAVPESKAASLGGFPGDKESALPAEEESPGELVAKIMEQVLTEKRKSPAAAPPSGGTTDAGNAEGVAATKAQATEPAETELAVSRTSDSAAPAVLTSPMPSPQDLDTSDSAGMIEPHAAEPAGTGTVVAAPAVPATGEEPVDSADVAATGEPREAESTVKADWFVPPVAELAAAENAELWSVAGSIAAEETWHVDSVTPIDEATQSLFDETPTPSATSSLTPEPADAAATELESALPTPAVRKWPPSAPLVSTTPTEQNQGSRPADSSQEETRELVPLKQYLYMQRLHFLRGAAIGILFCLVISVFAVKFWKPARQATSAEHTQTAGAVNSTIASSATIPERASPVGLTLGSKVTGSSEKAQDTIAPSTSSVGRADLAASSQPSRTSGITVSDNAAPASVQDGSSKPTNAIPRPSSFANRDSAAGGGVQPLFNLSQPANADGSTAGVAPENGQPKVGVDLGSTPWSFHRKNIHGTIPVGGEVRPAELISSVAPPYPQAAKARQISGDVVIDAIIDAHGNVRKPQVVSGPTLLRTAAVNAVLGWKYKPALLDGKPTEVHETITVKFLSQ